MSDAAAALGGLDILVCNASAFADGAGEEAFRAAFDVDLMHTRNACEAALPWLETLGRGSDHRHLVDLGRRRTMAMTRCPTAR